MIKASLWMPPLNRRGFCDTPRRWRVALKRSGTPERCCLRCLIFWWRWCPQQRLVPKTEFNHWMTFSPFNHTDVSFCFAGQNGQIRRVRSELRPHHPFWFSWVGGLANNLRLQSSVSRKWILQSINHTGQPTETMDILDEVYEWFSKTIWSIL